LLESPSGALDLVGMYIPENLLDCAGGYNQMKIQKMVSLDQATSQIAGEMKNFSKWVRDGLHAQSMGVDLASEYQLRVRWVGVARHLAATLIEYAKEMDSEYTGTVDEILADALKQLKIDEFQ
jgi:rRNA-processing protein FCF1